MEQVFQYFLVDAIWSQYIMALSEPGEIPERFDPHPWKYALYILFFCITFLS